jgi:hypothetical protein
MTEKQRYPKIQLDYKLTGEDLDASDVMLLAGKKYAETRQDAEEVVVNVQALETLTFVTYGRKVLEALSYAEIENEVEIMRTEIEFRIAESGAGDVLPHSRAGRRLSGRLPDRE